MRARTLVLALAAFSLLILLAPGARAELLNRELGVSFADSRTADLIARHQWAGTTADRERFDADHDGEVEFDEIDTPEDCEIGLGSLDTVALDDYPLRGHSLSCDADGVLGPVNGGGPMELTLRRRVVSPLLAARTIMLLPPAPSQVSLTAPSGRLTEFLSPAELPVAEQVNTVSGETPLLARFPTTGAAWEFTDARSNSTTMTLGPESLTWSFHLANSGRHAAASRASFDHDRDGSVTEAEVATTRSALIGALAYPVQIAGADREGRFAGAAFENHTGPVTYEGTYSQDISTDYPFTVPAESFTVRSTLFPGPITVVAGSGRTVSAVGGLTDVRVFDGGSRITANAPLAAAEHPVTFTFSALTVAPAPPAPLPAGVRERTALLTLATGSPTMRFEALDQYTQAQARDVRAAIDTDDDGVVQAVEIAAYETTLRNSAPLGASWPFRLDGRTPTSSRVASVEVGAVGSVVESGEPLWVQRVLEAQFAVSSGPLAAAAYDYGARLTLHAPAGMRLAAQTTGWTDPAFNADGSTLAGIASSSGWSATVVAPAATTPSGSAQPAVPDASNLTWRLTLQGGARARLETTYQAQGSLSQWSRALTDDNSDGTVSAGEVDVRRAALSENLRPTDLALSFGGRSPATLRNATTTLEGYVGAASGTGPLRAVQAMDLTFSAAVPVEIEVTGGPLRLQVVAPSGHRLEVVSGMPGAALASGGASLEGDVGSVPAVLRLVAIPPPPPTSGPATTIAPGPAPAPTGGTTTGTSAGSGSGSGSGPTGAAGGTTTRPTPTPTPTPTPATPTTAPTPTPTSATRPVILVDDPLPTTPTPTPSTEAVEESAMPVASPAAPSPARTDDGLVAGAVADEEGADAATPGAPLALVMVALAAVALAARRRRA